MNMDHFTLSQAFKALNEFDDEDLLQPIKVKGLRRVNEGGITVNLNDDAEIKDAQVALEKKETEPALQVIDVDADSLEHLKKGINYVGQMILKCKACHGLRFIDAEKLIEDTEEEDTYNVEEECPNCHIQGKGFTILGQVGEVPTFKNNIDTETQTDEVVETPEDIDVDNVVIDDSVTEDDVDDVEPDDTEDLDLPKLGDEFDPDDVPADDTEEETETVEEDEEEDVVEESLKDEDETETEEVEVETSDEEVEELPAPKALDLINKILEADDKEVLIYDNSEDVKKIFGGLIQNIPYAIKASELVGFTAPNLIVNIDASVNPEEADKVKYLLKLFNDKEIENISVYDVDSDEEIFTGGIDEVLSKFGDKYFVSFEVPSKINLYVSPEKEMQEIEDELVTDEDVLVSDIIKENYLNEYKINNPVSNEYWINDAIKSKEDLDVIYEQYVASTGNKDLIERFKKVTGYKDRVDEAKEAFETKIQNNKKPFNEDLEESQDKVYDLSQEIDDKDYDEVVSYIKDTFFPLEIEYDDLEISYGSELSWEYGWHAKGETTVNHTYSISEDHVSDDDIWDFVTSKFKDKFTKKDLDSIEADDLKKYFYDKFEDEAREEAEEEYEEIYDEGPDPDAEYDAWREEQYLQELEDVNEEATLGAKDELINKVADKIDKIIEAEKIQVQTVTDEGNPGQIGFLFTSEEDRAKAKPIIEKAFKEIRCVPGDTQEVQEDEAFGLTYDKIAIQLGIQLKERLCKNRKELVKAIKECQEKNIKFKIKRSLNENYRYTLIEEVEDELTDLVTIDDVTAKEKNLSPEAKEALENLMRISKDTVEALKDFYNIDVAPEAVLADMIKDLGLISGKIDIDSLEENDITRNMFNNFESFYHAYEDILSMLSGQPMYLTPEERFRRALRTLKSPAYSKEAIRDAIKSDNFLELVRSGQVPYIDPDIARAQLTEDVVDNEKDDGSDLFETPDTVIKETEIEDITSLEESRKRTWICEYDGHQLGKVQAEDEDEALEKMRQEFPEFAEEDVEALTRVYLDESVKENSEKEICQDEIESKLAALTQDEWEATKGYTDAINDIKDACAETDCACGDKINAVLDDIRDEELVHVGELEELLDVVDDDSKDLIKDGQEEAEEHLDDNDKEIEIVDDESEVEVNDSEEVETETVEEQFNPDDESNDWVDYESDKFDDEMNNYFRDNYEDTVVYRTDKGEIDKEGNIMLEGYLETENSRTPVKFLLKLDKQLNESNASEKCEKTYTVSNNLSEEIFTFKA